MPPPRPETAGRSAVAGRCNSDRGSGTLVAALYPHAVRLAGGHLQSPRPPSRVEQCQPIVRLNRIRANRRRSERRRRQDRRRLVDGGPRQPKSGRHVIAAEQIAIRPALHHARTVGDRPVRSFGPQRSMYTRHGRSSRSAPADGRSSTPRPASSSSAQLIRMQFMPADTVAAPAVVARPPSTAS